MKKLFYLSLLSLCFLSCKKDKNTQPLNGQYTGTFRTLSEGKLVITAFNVSLRGDQFKVTKGDKMGSGLYEIGVNNQVVFRDQQPWNLEFDWNLILSGDYTYQIKADSLILTKNLNPGWPKEYQYRLKKIN